MAQYIALAAAASRSSAGWQRKTEGADMNLQAQRVAVLATDGVEQVELTTPVEALRKAGAEVHVVAPRSGSITSFEHHDPSDSIEVDHNLSEVDASDYDALVLPGGVINPDALRIDDQAVGFVRSFVESDKPIAAICHGPWTLIEAGAVNGRRMTSWPSLQTDLSNAGADWVDEEVVIDGNLVTSRKPDDLPAFTRAAIDLFAAKVSG
jgi:protease I